MKISELKPGQKVWIASAVHAGTFKNSAVFNSGDRMNLGRDVGYFQFDRQGFLESEFALWQHELDSGRVVIESRSDGGFGHFKL